MLHPYRTDGLTPYLLSPHCIILDRSQSVEEALANALLLQAIVLADDGQAFWSDSVLRPSGIFHRAIQVALN